VPLPLALVDVPPADAPAAGGASAARGSRRAAERGGEAGGEGQGAERGVLLLGEALRCELDGAITPVLHLHPSEADEIYSSRREAKASGCFVLPTACVAEPDAEPDAGADAQHTAESRVVACFALDPATSLECREALLRWIGGRSTLIQCRRRALPCISPASPIVPTEGASTWCLCEVDLLTRRGLRF